MPLSGNAQIKNRLLGMLPREDLRKLMPRFEVVTLERRQVLQEPGEPIRYAYFPESGVVSFLTRLQDGSGVETATIGNEGMTGMRLLLGVDTGPAQVLVQVAGSALRIASDDLRNACERDTPLRRILLRYLSAFITQLTQSVACNTLHALENRLARWLLMTHDRVQANQFSLTHELLALMLGVRRASVTVAARKLQEERLIQYTHGKITVLDRAGLEKASCECYQAVKKDYDDLIA